MTNLNRRRPLATAIGLLLAGALFSAGMSASFAAGDRVRPVTSEDNFELFQTLVVMHSLTQLGMEMKAPVKLSDDKLLKAVADGDAEFMVSYLEPLDQNTLTRAGQDKLTVSVPVIHQMQRGFMTDAASSLRFDFVSMDQLSDRKLARRFDRNGNGKADLIGCPKASSCAESIDNKLVEFGLNKTVEQIYGNYDAMMTETVRLARELKPVLYYAANPGWVTGARVPNELAVWLTPPASATGFEENSLHIVFNSVWGEQNPEAGALLNLIRIDPEQISRQNLRVQLGENSIPDIERHARQWASSNESLINGWIRRAKEKGAEIRGRQKK